METPKGKAQSLFAKFQNIESERYLLGMYDDWYSFINSRDDLDDIMFEIGRFIIHIQQELQKHLADMFVLPQGTEHEYKFRITVE